MPEVTVGVAETGVVFDAVGEAPGVCLVRVRAEWLDGVVKSEGEIQRVVLVVRLW